MGTMPVNRLLISMSLPMIISMLVQALYNIIDSVFVAQISEAALAAVSMAFPVQSLMIAVSSGTCVGVNALLSRSLGEGKPEEARLTAVNGIFLAILGACLPSVWTFRSSYLFFQPDLRSAYYRIRYTVSGNLYGVLLRNLWRNHPGANSSVYRTNHLQYVLSGRRSNY